MSRTPTAEGPAPGPGARVAFIGLGNMGGPMASRAAAAGFEVRGHDLDPAVWDRQEAAEGLTRAGSAPNNLLSGEGLMAAVEALRAGARFGLRPETMVEVLNGSSGRSSSTEYKLPTFVIPREFTSGFSVGLMLKDFAEPDG